MEKAPLMVALLPGLLSLACSQAEPAEPPAGAFRYELAYSTFFGGPEDERAREVIVYDDGSVLVGMHANSRNLPTPEGAFQRQYAGDRPRPFRAGLTGGDLYLFRLDASGRKLLAATYFGGSKQERSVYGMELDRDGNVVIAGMTRSRDLPITPGAVQPRYGGGKSDWLVAKLSADLKQLIWSTYLGGGGDDTPRGGLAIDPSGRVVVVGSRGKGSFPGIAPAEAGKTFGAVITWLDADGALVRTKQLGASRGGVVVGVRADSAGNLVVAGHTDSPDFPVTKDAAQPELGGGDDNFIAKLSSEGELVYSTFQGGSANEFAEHRVAIDGEGRVLLTGATESRDFPTSPGVYQDQFGGRSDGFLVVLRPDGRSFGPSAYLGGAKGDVLLMPTLAPDGSIFMVGQTSSSDFPVTAEALQPRNAGGDTDGVIAALSADASRLLYASYLGGSAGDFIRSMAFGPKGEIYLVGRTKSKDFPVTPDAFQPEHGGGYDAFLVKLVPLQADRSE